MTKFYRCGQAVVARGRVGMISEMSFAGVVVQYGQAGPYATYAWDDVRHATKEDIKEAGLEGVGFEEVSDE